MEIAEVVRADRVHDARRRAHEECRDLATEGLLGPLFEEHGRGVVDVERALHRGHEAAVLGLAEATRSYERLRVAQAHPWVETLRPLDAARGREERLPRSRQQCDPIFEADGAVPRLAPLDGEAEAIYARAEEILEHLSRRPTLEPSDLLDRACHGLVEIGEVAAEGDEHLVRLGLGAAEDADRRPLRGDALPAAGEQVILHREGGQLPDGLRLQLTCHGRSPPRVTLSASDLAGPRR
ncbi:MAG: hypothetical protein QM820_61815 [Minicystis sp.]